MGGRPLKRHGILNSEIASVLAHMGHTDTIVIADCGLPIPDHVKKIDLAITKGLPAFIDVLQHVLEDMVVEKVTLAEEIRTFNPELLSRIERCIPHLKPDYLTHEQFKIRLNSAKAVIRTGEATPYANIILQSGVIF
jgi:D-ribose pyranase